MFASANETGCPFDHDDDWRLNWHEPMTCVYNPDCDEDAVSDGAHDVDDTGPVVPGPDNCVLTPNSGQADWDADALGDNCDDGDDDGFIDSTEWHVGTAPTIRCGGNGWPADIYNEAASYNKITIQDVLSFVAPIRHLDTSPGESRFNERWDLVPGTTVLMKHINIQDLLELITLRPPMFAGALAYNKACPTP